MNIDQEREAFEADQKVRHPGCDLRRWADAYRSNIVEAAFQSWLAAKEHAKPVIDVYLRQTHVGTAWTYSGASGGMTFKNKELAIAHALAHGYRECK